MNFVDFFSLMLHRLVAEKMLSQEAEVLQTARDNLERWLKSESFAEAKDLLCLNGKKFLKIPRPKKSEKLSSQDTDESQRLRSSSPFAGVLSEAEREKIWSECAEIRPV